jgi:hypothetical protein
LYLIALTILFEALGFLAVAAFESLGTASETRLVAVVLASKKGILIPVQCARDGLVPVVLWERWR